MSAYANIGAGVVSREGSAMLVGRRGVRERADYFHVDRKLSTWCIKSIC